MSLLMTRVMKAFPNDPVGLTMDVTVWPAGSRGARIPLQIWMLEDEVAIEQTIAVLQEIIDADKKETA